MQVYKIQEKNRVYNQNIEYVKAVIGENLIYKYSITTKFSIFLQAAKNISLGNVILKMILFTIPLKSIEAFNILYVTNNKYEARTIDGYGNN